jgi:hypothetical protein
VDFWRRVLVEQPAFRFPETVVGAEAIGEVPLSFVGDPLPSEQLLVQVPPECPLRVSVRSNECGRMLVLRWPGAAAPDNYCYRLSLRDDLAADRVETPLLVTVPVVAAVEAVRASLAISAAEAAGNWQRRIALRGPGASGGIQIHWSEPSLNSGFELVESPSAQGTLDVEIRTLRPALLARFAGKSLSVTLTTGEGRGCTVNVLVGGLTATAAHENQTAPESRSVDPMNRR